MARQQTLGFDLHVPQCVYKYGVRTTGETHGVILTKPHIVKLILDLATYTSTCNLTKLRLLEPSCGEGVFLKEAARRLLESAKRHGVPIARLGDAIRAYDTDEASVVRTRTVISDLLFEIGVDRRSADSLVAAWIHRADFLLASIAGRFDVVVGNPPYVRIEHLDPQLQATYRRRFKTIFDRADLYVAFIERSLELLSSTGLLSFICADRWTLNRYGAPLRNMIACEYGVRVYVDLHQTSPFESNVIAYPSIFVFERTRPERVVFAKLREGSIDECAALAEAVDYENLVSTHAGLELFQYERWFEGDEPWVLGSPEQLAVLRELESRFPALEADGMTRVGIGVATGADEVFIVTKEMVHEIEPDRLVPLVMRSDIHEGRIDWSGHYVINTFRANEGVVDLADYPKLAAYFAKHDAVVRRRHIAQRSNDVWFRTIDRVYSQLVHSPKLLIPDIAGSNGVAYDAGQYHPHHNLYFVTSDSWNLEVLGGLLSSKIALFLFGHTQ